MGRKKYTESGIEVVLTEEMKDNIALQSIEEFFRGKSWWCGGPIPKSELFTRDNIKLVRNTSVETSFGFMYEVLIPQLPSIPDGEDPESLAPDIVFALMLLYDAHSRALPRIHIPGLLLLYFRVCKGLSIDSVMP